VYSNVLIPTDGSEIAGKAVEHGIALAKGIGAKITAMTVLPPFHTFTTDRQLIEDTPAKLAPSSYGGRDSDSSPILFNPCSRGRLKTPAAGHVSSAASRRPGDLGFTAITAASALLLPPRVVEQEGPIS
jgi:nucleotide-binding universal stress UspA family protein